MDNMRHFGDITFKGKNGVIEPLKCIKGQEKDYSSYVQVDFLMNISELRKELTFFLLKRRDIKDENKFYDLEDFARRHSITDITPYYETIKQEVEKQGWKCQKSFGDTLFIFSTEKAPPSCH